MLADHRLILPELKQVSESMNHHKLHRVFCQVSFFWGKQKCRVDLCGARVWDLETQQCTCRMDGHTGPVACHGLSGCGSGLLVKMYIKTQHQRVQHPRNLRKPLSEEVPMHFYHFFQVGVLCDDSRLESCEEWKMMKCIPFYMFIDGFFGLSLNTRTSPGS